MSQHDYNIANAGGAAVRSDINNALAAVQSLNSGSTEPTATKPFMPWYDTATGALKMRNAGDTDWISMAEAVGGLSLRNKIINGDMGIWQRGTSFAAAASIVYTADRWAFYRQALGVGATASQTQAASIIGGSSYGIRAQRNSGNTSVDPLILSQCIETAIARRLQGQTVTLSYKQRTGGNISSATVAVYIYYGTGTDQGVNSARAGSWTGQATLASSFPTGASGFTTQTFTTAIPSTATELMVSFVYTPTGTAGAADFFDITDVQLELGPVATPFEHRPIGMELALCQRYYTKLGGDNANDILIQAYAGSAGISNALTLTLPVSMRASPTAAKNGTWSVSNCAQPAVVAASINTLVINTPATVAGNMQTGTLNATTYLTAVSEL